MNLRNLAIIGVLIMVVLAAYVAFNRGAPLGGLRPLK